MYHKNKDIHTFIQMQLLLLNLICLHGIVQIKLVVRKSFTISFV